MGMQIKVWDLPTRAAHWLLAGAFVVAFVSAESERWRLVHVISGAIVAGAIVFRLLWGFVGSRYARFADFVTAPRTVVAYLKSTMTGNKRHFVGHNPAGGWSVLALLAACALIVGSGLLSYFEMGPRWSGRFHEWVSNGALALSALHVLGVVAGSLLDRENLVRAMITGRKQGDSAAAIASNRPAALLVLMVICAAAVGAVTR